jgi:hypothetical protein
VCAGAPKFFGPTYCRFGGKTELSLRYLYGFGFMFLEICRNSGKTL